MISQSSKSALRNPWVLGFLGFVVVVLAVDITFVWFTMQKGRSELVERDYKTNSRKSNEQVVSELRSQQALGWQVEVKKPRKVVVGSPAHYEVVVTDRDGRPVSGTLEVRAYRASDASQDFTTQFRELAPGHYQGTLSFPLKGYWELYIRVQRGEHKFSASTTRFMVEAA